MHTLLITDTVSRIAIEYAPVLAAALGLALLLAATHYLGGWPDLWRARRAVLPHLARVGSGEYDHALDAVDERTPGDLNELTDQVPEKTSLPLQAVEYAGTIDAPPAVVRSELLEMERMWPCTVASIQYDIDADGDRVWEVGSYAFRPEGFLGSWQYHVRLTPADGGRRTRLWAHWERSAWRHPIKHYDAEGWDAEEGVAWLASLFAGDERYEPSDAAMSDTAVKAIGAGDVVSSN